MSALPQKRLECCVAANNAMGHKRPSAQSAVTGRVSGVKSRVASCFVSRRRLGARQPTTDHKITPAATTPVTAEKSASGMSKRSAIGIYSSIWATIVCPLAKSFELYVGTDPYVGFATGRHNG